MKGLSRIVALCLFAVLSCLAFTAPVEAGGFVVRRGLFAPLVVAQPQALIVPRQRVVFAPQAFVAQPLLIPQRLIVPQAFSVQQSLVAPFGVQQLNTGCGALLIR